MLKKKNNKQRIFIVFATVFAVFLFFSISVNAELCPNGVDHSEMNGVVKYYCDLYDEVTQAKLFSSEGETGLSVANILKFDTKTSFSVLWGSAKVIYNSVMPLGYILLIVYFIIDLADKVVQDKFTADQFLKKFIQLAVGLILLLNGFDFISIGSQIASAAYTLLENYTNNPFSDSTVATTCTYCLNAEMDTWDGVGAIFGLFIPFMAQLIAKLIIKVIVWGRCLNIIIYTMFAPIGMSDMAINGMQSQGFRYLKRLVAQFLQGAIILGISISYGLISSVVLSATNGATWVPAIILAFVLITLMFKSKSLAEEVMGV